MLLRPTLVAFVGDPLDGVSSFAVTGASVSQMTTLAGLNFVTHLEIRDGIANLEGFTPDQAIIFQRVHKSLFTLRTPLFWS